MFGKNNSTYMFPQLVSANSQIHHSRIVDLNDLDLSIHHDVLAGHYLAANAPAGVNQGVSAGDPMAGVTTAKKQAAAKRDRHSKIYTSQGPRDRRVRLSIGIARKFFDLQELLGFDKPSKTLDWLLTESKSAIKDLTELQTKQTDPQNPSPYSSPSEVDSSGNPENNAETSHPGKGKSVANPDKQHKPGKDPQQIAAMNLAKESRVKARARARERTREKMYIKQMNSVSESSSNPSMVPIQYMNNQLNDFCRISGSSSSSSSSTMKMNPQDILHFPPNLGGASEIRKKMKNPSSVWGFQQNLPNSRELSNPNCNLVPFPYNNSTENWDFSSIASSQTNLYAILDQHRFLNRM